jgi:isocitrate lyase
MSSFDQQVAAAREWIASPRFAGLKRLFSARDIAEQQGSIRPD